MGKWVYEILVILILCLLSFTRHLRPIYLNFGMVWLFQRSKSYINLNNTASPAANNDLFDEQYKLQSLNRNFRAHIYIRINRPPIQKRQKPHFYNSQSSRNSTKINDIAFLVHSQFIQSPCQTFFWSPRRTALEPKTKAILLHRPHYNPTYQNRLN